MLDIFIVSLEAAAVQSVRKQINMLQPAEPRKHNEAGYKQAFCTHKTTVVLGSEKTECALFVMLKYF